MMRIQRHSPNLRIPPFAESRLTGPTPPYVVVFCRDASGRITGLTAGTQRVQNMHFVKRG